MDKKSLPIYRNEIIEKFINIEWLINAIISQRYFKKVVSNFLFEFLNDEYCSFGLKRRVFEKIVPNLDKTKLDDLNRLNTIRNYFAHCGQKVFKGVVKLKCHIKGEVVDPRNPQKTINFEELYEEFIDKYGALTKYLAEIYESLGGVFIK